MKFDGLTVFDYFGTSKYKMVAIVNNSIIADKVWIDVTKNHFRTDSLNDHNRCTPNNHRFSSDRLHQKALELKDK